MQNEENSTSSESLENIEYETQGTGNGVLAQADLVGQENSYVETTMETDGHRGIKRATEVENSLATDHELPAKPLKKTKGRVKIKMEFIDNKLRRYTTFSKRKTGIMKKAYELSTLTGTQVMLLVASETGHVYTFATRKLQPMITSESGKALIQTCLNSPDPPVNNGTNPDQRMSATGYEETDLTYSVNENDEKDQKGGIFTTQAIDVGQVVNSSNTGLTGITLPTGGQYSFPMTTYLPPQGNKSGPASYSVQAVPGGAFTTIFTPGTTFSPGSAVQLQQAAQGQNQQQQQLIGQQIQLQRIQSATSNNSQSNNILSVSQPNSNAGLSMVTVAEGQVNHDQSENATGTTGNQGYINVVPITANHDAVTLANVGSSVVLSTSQAGQLPVLYSVYTPSNSLGEGGGEHVTHITQEAMTQQGLPVSLQTSLSNVASALSVQQELPPQTVTIHQDNSTTEVTIVDANSIGVVTENDIDKGGMGNAEQNEV